MRILNRITGNVIKFKSFRKFVSSVRVGIVDHDFNVDYHLPSDNCLEKQSYLACDNMEQLQEDFYNTKKNLSYHDFTGY